MKRTVSILLIVFLTCSLAIAGQGMGPGPGVKGYAAGGGGCTTTSTLLDKSGTNAGNSISVDSTTRALSGRFVGNGKVLKSITLKTGTDEGATTTATVFVNTAQDFSGTVTASTTVATPGAVSTEYTATFVGGPTLANGTTYYWGVYAAGASWGTRFGNSMISDNVDHLYWYSTDGLDGTWTASTDYSLWVKVTVCDN